ncbi:MAG: transglutaminase domain-containing protein, partial [Pseudobutyrivibrio sp.]|nr:transglutaminase domain-containing protein [Pseudobutyrivibrio sp.]
MRKVSNLLSLIVLCISLAACGTMGGPASEDPSGSSSGGAQAKESKQGTRDNTIRVLTPEASGTEVYENDDASIDESNASDGYVMVAYKGSA